MKIGEQELLNLKLNTADNVKKVLLENNVKISLRVWDKVQNIISDTIQGALGIPGSSAAYNDDAGIARALAIQSEQVPFNLAQFQAGDEVIIQDMSKLATSPDEFSNTCPGLIYNEKQWLFKVPEDTVFTIDATRRILVDNKLIYMYRIVNDKYNVYTVVREDNLESAHAVAVE